MAAAGARPGVLSLNIREKAALYAAYMPFLKGGGIFIPTSRQYQLGEEVFMLLSLMDDPNRIAVQGKVVWITPEGVQGNRTQGIGVQFTQDETGAAARATIEKILGETLASIRARRIRCSVGVANSARAQEVPTEVAPCRPHPDAASRRFRRSLDVRRFPLPSRFPRARSRAASVLDAMAASEVTHALCIGVNLPDWPAVHALAMAHPNLYATRRRASRLRGHARADGGRPRRAGAAAQGRSDRRDGARLFPSRGRPRMAARAVPRAHPCGAPRRGKPLVIHTRAAAADTLAIMREERAREAGGVMHCFTENWDVARAALDLGFHISFSGIVTFKNALE